MSRHQRLKQLNPVFHMKQKSEDNEALSRGMIKQALKSGCLNLSGRGLAFGEYLFLSLLLCKFGNRIL